MSQATDVLKVNVTQSCLTLSNPHRTVARQAPLSRGLPRQEYWSGFQFPSPGELPDPGIEPSSAWKVESLPAQCTNTHCYLMLLSEAAAKSLQSCPTLCDPMDCSPPGTVVHGILQARTLEWVAISYAKGSSQPRNRTLVSCISGRLFTSYKGRPLQSTEQHLQILPLDVSSVPHPLSPTPSQDKKMSHETVPKVPWDKIPLVQNRCSRASLMQRTHKPHWKYHFHPLLHCSVLPNKSVLFL